MRPGTLAARHVGGLVVALAILASFGLQRLGPGGRLDLLAFDQLSSLVAAGEPLVVVVEIDQQSLERLGRWPWPRHLHAELIERLAAAGPAAIGYDVLFAEAAADDPSGDAALVAAVAAAGSVVLPMIGEQPNSQAPPLEIVPLAGLAEAAAGIGHSHLAADPDGRLRRLYRYAGVADAYWPAFAMAVRDVAAGTAGATPDPHAATPSGPRNSATAAPPMVLDWVVEQPILVPIPQSRTRLRRVSAADIARGRSPGDIAGAVVLVGATARGLQAWVDIGPGIAGATRPPIDFNAFAVQALLQGKTVRLLPRPGVAAMLLAGGAFLPWLCSLLLGAAPVRRRTILALAPVLPLAAGVVALLGWRLLLPQLSVAVAIAAVLLAAQLLGLSRRVRRTRQERSLAHAALTNVADAVLTTDPANRVDYANPAAERLLCPPDGTLVGRRLEDIAPQLMQHPPDGDAVVPPGVAGHRPTSREQQPIQAAAWRALPLTAADGSRRIVKAVIRRRNDTPRPGYVIALNDVTDERRLLDKVAFHATHDGLTRLPNRHLVIDRLGNAIERARRHRRWVAAAFLDVDRLKSINDALGTAVGDAVLVEIAERLTAVGRSGDTIGRHSGDEFVLLLEDVTSKREVEAGIDRYRRCLVPPVEVDGRRFEIKTSIGVACFPTDAATADDLLRRADAAMYRAKFAGRDQVVFYDAAVHGEESGGLLLDEALRQGIARDEFELHYQPRIDLVRRRPSGVEALVRWRHPEQGFLPPGRFIGLAEETGSIVELGRWVLARACADLAGPPLRSSGLRLSINVSVVQLKRDQGFVDFVRATLARHQLDPARLELEITESLFLDPSLPMLGRRLADLAALGIHLSIDDFGTGYSSLAYINRFPFDRIKIDRSFIHAAGSDKSAQAIIRAIVGLSQALAKKTTAEGVEATEQLALLDELRCNEAQGYLFGRPAPLPDLLDQLAA